MPWGSLSHDTRSGGEPPAETTRETFASEASARGLLLVELTPPKAVVRGRLGLFIEGAIERALDLRGAPPPRSAGTNFADSISDQVRRAQVCGVDGVALWFSSLAEIAKCSELDPDDSKAVRFCIEASADEELSVGFDDKNGALLVFGKPERLDTLVREARRRAEAETLASEIPSAFSPSRLEMSDLVSDRDSIGVEAGPVFEAAETDASDDAEASHYGDDVHDTLYPDPGTIPDLDVDEPRDAFRDLAESARALADDLPDDLDSAWLRDALLELSTPPPRPSDDLVRASDDDFLPSPAKLPALDIRFADPGPGSAETSELETAEDREPANDPPPLESELAGFDAEETDASPLVAAMGAAPPKVDAPRAAGMDASALQKLTAHARELELANGPKPLAVVERLFSQAYVPIRAALDRGAALPELRETADEWAKNFEKSYLDAFEALRVRTKRPAMVVDVADIALRVARLHGARATQLLLVDAMRFDIGDLIQDKLRCLVGQRAACADRFLLWSALPTRTSTQIELIGRGPSGLREFTGEVSEDLVVARGKKASTIRRLKTGHRELYKLDVIEARIGEPGGASPELFDDLANEAAERIAAHFDERESRTLVMVFGDHGFQLERRGDQMVARQGGASPEEVLVPAFAWLVGAVH